MVEVRGVPKEVDLQFHLGGSPLKQDTDHQVLLGVKLSMLEHSSYGMELFLFLSYN